MFVYVITRYQDREGWAPAMYLKKPEPSQLQAIRHGSASLAREKGLTQGSSVTKPYGKDRYLKPCDRDSCMYYRFPPTCAFHLIMSWFCITRLNDWFKKLAPLFHPIRRKHDWFARVFPRFWSATV